MRNGSDRAVSLGHGSRRARRHGRRRGVGNVLLAAALAIGLHHIACAPTRATRGVSAVLRSGAPYHAAKVDVKEDGDRLFVTANVGGRSLTCCVDTGDPVVTLPSNLSWPVDAVRAGRTTGIDGRTIDCRRGVLHYIRLGGMVASDVAVDVVAASERGRANPCLAAPILGMDLFRDCIVTIDYRAHSLTVRGATFDPAQHMASSAVVLPFANIDDPQERSDYAGVPTVAVTVAGRTVPFCLDTGYNGSMLMSCDAARTCGLQATRPALGSGLGGTFTSGVTAPVPFSIGAAMRGSAPVDIGPGQSSNHENCLGNTILRNFRVTIDCPRSRVILEPYDHGDRGNLADPRAGASTGAAPTAAAGGAEVVVNGRRYVGRSGVPLVITFTKDGVPRLSRNFEQSRRSATSGQPIGVYDAGSSTDP